MNISDSAARLAEEAYSGVHGARCDWERLFDAISDPICVIAPDYRLLYTNAAYRALFGSADGQQGWRYCYARGAPPDGAADNGSPEWRSPCVECPLPETLRARRPGFTLHEWRPLNLPADTGASAQQAQLYQCWTYPVMASDGAVECVVEVLKDVTEQERMRSAIVRAEALREADREADRLKAELLGTVSHELRSPLTAIKGYAATLLRHEHRLPREERREFLAAIGAASDQLESIINRLLELSQLEMGSITAHLASVDVAQVARQTISVAERRAQVIAPSQYHFTFHQDTLAPVVAEVDQRLLYIALDNLLENAVKYSPAGGDIDVALTRRAADAAPEAMETLDITVRDRGMGIPAEHLGRVFERFHRVDTRLAREVDGLGLGLALCKRIAELHGGAIWVESAPGSGSAFHLTLPIRRRSATSGAGAAYPEETSA